jgi:two-component system response regulator FlrC
MAETLPVLVVEDDADLREALTDTLELAGYSAIAAADAEQALAWLEKGNPGLVLERRADARHGWTHALLRMLKARRPDIPVILMTAYGQIELRRPGHPRRRGGLPAQALRTGPAAGHGGPIFPPGGGNSAALGMVAEDSASTRALLDLARKRGRTREASVLLTGESGVGKEVFARYIHQHSAAPERSRSSR